MLTSSSTLTFRKNISKSILYVQDSIISTLLHYYYNTIRTPQRQVSHLSLFFSLSQQLLNFIERGGKTLILESYE